MKTFSTKISQYAKRTRESERAHTLAIVRHMLTTLDGEKWEQAIRILRKGKQTFRKQSTGPFSGLTRRELAMSGTCETDWF